MKASEIMTREVVTVHTATSVRHAATLLTERGITSLPVLDDDERVVGIVSPSFVKMSLLYATVSVFRSIGMPKILFL